MIPKSHWCLGTPDYGKPYPPPTQPSTASPPDHCIRATVFERATNLLAPHPKSIFRLREGEKFLSSTPPRSQLTEDSLKTAVHAAGRYNDNPPIGRGLYADRIQRLVLGIAELLQAELVADPKFDVEQLLEELHAAQRCLVSALEDVDESISGDHEDGDGDDQ